ncbi:MAG: hypothetical protein IKA76_08735 [Clostridia bacterium]|nr:hypothetical protein [Clostridia bacterium]
MFAFLLCFSLLFVGCRENEENIPNGDSEILSDTEAVESEITESETVTESEKITETEAMTESEEITESEKTTESEEVTDSERVTESETVTESEEVTETEEESESEEVTESQETEEGGDGYSPTDHYGSLTSLSGAVVRWGSVVEDESPVSDFEGVSGEVSDFLLAFDMIKVGIEVLDVVEHEYSCTDEIFALKTLLIPRDAMKSVAEGDESLVFFYYQTVGYTEDDLPVYIGYLDPYPFAWNHPIFQFEDERMIMDESQMIEYGSEDCKMKFLYYAYHANQSLAKHGIDEKYHFRNGMTVEELEQFYQAVKDLPLPNVPL